MTGFFTNVESRTRLITFHEMHGVAAVGVVASGKVDTMTLAIVEGDMLSSLGGYRHDNLHYAKFGETYEEGDKLAVRVDVAAQRVQFWKNGRRYGPPVPAHVADGYHFVVDAARAGTRVSIEP